MGNFSGTVTLLPSGQPLPSAQVVATRGPCGEGTNGFVFADGAGTYNFARSGNPPYPRRRSGQLHRPAWPCVFVASVPLTHRERSPPQAGWDVRAAVPEGRAGAIRLAMDPRCARHEDTRLSPRTRAVPHGRRDRRRHGPSVVPGDARPDGSLHPRELARPGGAPPRGAGGVRGLWLFALYTPRPNTLRAGQLTFIDLTGPCSGPRFHSVVWAGSFF